MAREGILAPIYQKKRITVQHWVLPKIAMN
jgi:hypothetical protein